MIFNKNYNPPTPLATNDVVLSVLAPDVVEQDYAVVMKNRHRLRSIFTEHDEWPADDMSLADNLADLQMHQREYNEREAYAYVIHTPKGEYVGCAYVYPPSVTDYDAELFFWVDEHFVFLEPQLEQALTSWLTDDWNIPSLALPGRTQPWSSWAGKLFHSE